MTQGKRGKKKISMMINWEKKRRRRKG